MLKNFLITSRIILGGFAFIGSLSFAVAESGQERGGADPKNGVRVPVEFIKEVFENPENIKSLRLYFDYIESKNIESFRPMFADRSTGGAGSVFEYLDSLQIGEGKNVSFGTGCTDAAGRPRSLMADKLSFTNPLSGEVRICLKRLSREMIIGKDERPSLVRKRLLALFVHELAHIFLGSDERIAEEFPGSTLPLAEELLKKDMLKYRAELELRLLSQWSMLLKNNVSENQIKSENIANICNSIPAIQYPMDFMSLLDRGAEANITYGLMRDLATQYHEVCKSLQPIPEKLNRFVQNALDLNVRLTERMPHLLEQRRMLNRLSYPLIYKDRKPEGPLSADDTQLLVEPWKLCGQRPLPLSARVIPYPICLKDTVISIEAFSLGLGNEVRGTPEELVVEESRLSESTSSKNKKKYLKLVVNGREVNADSIRKKVNCFTAVQQGLNPAATSIMNICPNSVFNYHTLFYGDNLVKVLSVYEGGLVSVQYYNATKRSSSGGTIVLIEAKSLSPVN